jgi:hypothetical protein
MLKVSVCLLAALAAVPQSSGSDAAARIVSRAIDAIGGQAALTGIKTLQIDAIGHEYYIEQSERPEGPFIVGYLSTSEKRDVEHAQSRIELQRRSSPPAGSAPERSRSSTPTPPR